MEAFRFRLNGVELPFTGDGITIATSNTNASPIPESACKEILYRVWKIYLLMLALVKPASEKPSRATAFRWATETATTDILYYSWAAETDKLDLQLAMIEYYLAKGLLLGLGTANVKLDSSIGSQSQRAPAFSVSYQYPLFKNFFVEANYTLLQTDLSLQKEISTSITEAAIDQTDTREIGFLAKGNVLGVSQSLLLLIDGLETIDRRITVTRSQTRSAVQATTTKTVEVKNPSALTIKFTYKFW